MLLLACTEELRSRSRARIVSLAERVDFESLARLLATQTLLALFGSRLERLAPDTLPGSFRRQVQETIERGRRRALLFETTALRLVAQLERAGIATVELKGASLARSIHRDPGLRPSLDVDLLVGRADLERAASVIERFGYDALGPAEPNGHPRLHYSLRHVRGELPLVELHWRIHWYEDRFSAALLSHATHERDNGRRPAPPDELAALLVFYARDGFAGLRYAVDIAAWWDVHGDRVESHALEPVAEAHPELRRTLQAAGAVAERLVGLPAARLLGAQANMGRRPRLAARLANWDSRGNGDQLMSNIALVDWLLTPPGGQRAFARRRLVPPTLEFGALPSLPDGARHLWQLLHPVKLTVRFVLALWAIRRGRSWAPVPAVTGGRGHYVRPSESS